MLGRVPLPLEEVGHTSNKSLDRRLVLNHNVVHLAVLATAVLEPPLEEVIALLGLDASIAGADRDVGNLVEALPFVVNEAYYQGHNAVIKDNLERES